MVIAISHKKVFNAFCLTVSVDIKGAFDNITNSAMLNRMRNLDCDAKMIDWFSDFFHNRQIMVGYKDVAITRYAARGSPQGGIFSPWIFNILIDLLHKELNTIPGIMSQGFADDSVIQCIGTDLKLLYHQMQLALNACDIWANSMGLEFSAAKTKVVLFTKKRAFTNPYTLTLSNNDLKLSEGFTYLGVYLDSHLSYHQHIRNKIRDAKGICLRTNNYMTFT